MYHIYALIDPLSLECKYIGKSKEVNKRYRYHCTVPNKNNARLRAWVNKLKQYGGVPVLCILEETADNINLAEIFWIAYFKFIGAKLLNISKGGEGGDFTDIQRTKISQSVKAIWANPQYRARLSEIQKVVQNTPEIRQIRSIKATQRLQNTEVYERQVTQLLHHAQNPKRLQNLRIAAQNEELRARKSDAMKVRMADPQQVERVQRGLRTPESIAKHLASTTSDEARQRMSKLQKALWSDPAYREKMRRARNRNHRS